ncbi:MAG TPA: ferric reductase-like transmembrane domain-containing protein [Gemmatimonadaceae bacterium]|nr:ferric reductase-like transmembrane domain-containing protein [Gemmatimonadaceae bacterium]
MSTVPIMACHAPRFVKSARKSLMRWAALYVTLALLPLVLLFVPPRLPGRSLFVEYGVGLGFVGLALLGLQFVLTGRFHRVASSLGLDTMLQFHREAGIIAALFVLGHVVVLLLYRPGYRVFLDPRVDAARALALWLVLIALLLLIALTLLRRRLGLPYEWWRAAHAVFASAVLLIGTVHVLRVGRYVSVPWRQTVWIAAVFVALGLLLHVRIIRPLQARRKPWRVVEIRRERGSAWTLTLVPVGHGGLRFDAGQFVWLSFDPSALTLQQHPFSLSSSAERPEQIELTIKELGDFTSRIGEVRPGRAAFLEGPYGAFTLPPDVTGAVFIPVAWESHLS